MSRFDGFLYSKRDAQENAPMLHQFRTTPGEDHRKYIFAI
jgi:hypothetical protein